VLYLGTHNSYGYNTKVIKLGIRYLHSIVIAVVILFYNTE
jgi:hypothetical protein